MTALYSVVLRLKAENDAVVSPTQGPHAYALFLDLLGQSSQVMADRLHRDDAHKPFTVSPLLGRFNRAGAGVAIVQGAEYGIRLTFLSDDIYAHFMDAACKAAERPLHLEAAVFGLQQVCFNYRQSPLCRMSSYEELYYGDRADHSLKLKFTSPTVFRSGGKRNILVPEPGLVFSSYLRKWQQFSPLKYADSLAKSLRALNLAWHRLRTYRWHFNDYVETGFEGECLFKIPEDMDLSTVRAVNALANFAFYCGTGAKTTMGMGQTRRIK